MTDARPRRAQAASAPSWQRWLLRLALLLPPLAILAAGIPRIVTGLALEAAFPATAYIGMNVVLPQRTYAATAAILSHAAAADGDTQILRLEAARLSREPSERLFAPVQAALARAPASARGWILLSSLLAEREPMKAAAALTLGLELAPREYYLIPPRVAAGAKLWRHLAPDARERVLGDARSLLTDQHAYPMVRRLLAAPGGPALVTRSFAGRPEELRAFNRRMTRERLGL